ncbi:MAG: protein kinase [Thermosynechococcaceae cyanobacterium]
MNVISLSTGNKLAGRYRVLRKLGEGSFAETFLAEDELLPNGFRCVVKKLKTAVEEASRLQVAKRLFDLEAHSLHRLGSHTQVPQLFAHFEEDREFYLVEEYIQGSSLYQELASGQRWSEGYTINLLQDILEVLKFVHQKQVIHRDIKPSNIIRRIQDGKLVLIDFGAVKQVPHQAFGENGSAVTQTVIVGTPGYMPGEQLLGSPRMSSDVYAVGVLAIYALTGLNPALGQLPSDESTAELVWHDRANVSPELTAILDKMTAYDFRQRYPSATEAFEAIHALARCRPTDAPTRLKETSGSIEIPTNLSEGAALDSGMAVDSKPKRIFINLQTLGGVIGNVLGGNPALSSNNILEKTAIQPLEPMAIGTVAASGVSFDPLAGTEVVASPVSRRSFQSKLAILGGIGMVALGAIATIASPHIGLLCQAFNNCPVEAINDSRFGTAGDSAKSVLMGVKEIQPLSEIERAAKPLEPSKKQLPMIDTDQVTSNRPKPKVSPSAAISPPGKAEGTQSVSSTAKPTPAQVQSPSRSRNPALKPAVKRNKTQNKSSSTKRTKPIPSQPIATVKPAAKPKRSKPKPPIDTPAKKVVPTQPQRAYSGESGTKTDRGSAKSAEDPPKFKQTTRHNPNSSGNRKRRDS